MTSDDANADASRAALLAFLQSIVKPGGNVEQATDDDNLFESGILDSLAIIQIIVYLEQSHAVSLAAQGIDPTELSSIGGILNAIEHAAR